MLDEGAFRSSSTARHSVDLNSDLGEGYGHWTMGDDQAMLAIVTSANIACGAHAGDPQTMLASIRLAAQQGVAVGAHVGYRDLAGFGRRDLDVDPSHLYADVLFQIAAICGVADSVGYPVRYVKPHGALYNRVVGDAAQARLIVQAILDFKPGLALLGLPGSAAQVESERLGLRFFSEAFVDRAYNRNGTLVSRDHPAALITDPPVVAARAVGMVTEGSVTAIDGSRISIRADSLCVHGDSPNAVAMALAVRREMTAAGLALKPFLDSSERMSS